jgi:GMP synthase (glutamine-hydrolysing)
MDQRPVRGVDSSTVTLLGHRALGEPAGTVFVENGLMRKGRGRAGGGASSGDLGVHGRRWSTPATASSSPRSRGITDPEEKREAITQTFYRDVFGRIVRRAGPHLLQGTILTDIDETVAGIKRQHNVFAQLGIDPQEAFGYQILEPLVQLRKDGVRKWARPSACPPKLFERIPFPGPALAARVIGEATPERIETVRQGHGRGRAAARRHAARSSTWRSCTRPRHRHARRQARLRPPDRGALLGQRRRPHGDPHPAALRRPPGAGRGDRGKVPGVVSVTYNIAPKPPSTIEAVPGCPGRPLRPRPA